MDKQKQIEEMARFLYNQQKWCDMTNPYEVAQLLSNAGYCKIPEGAVVLTEDKELAKMGYRKQDVIAEEILKKVYSYTLDDEIGMRWLLRELAKDYGVELK